jgi:hypothetical protein
VANNVNIQNANILFIWCISWTELQEVTNMAVWTYKHFIKNVHQFFLQKVKSYLIYMHFKLYNSLLTWANNKSLHNLHTLSKLTLTIPFHTNSNLSAFYTI